VVFIAPLSGGGVSGGGGGGGRSLGRAASAPEG